MYKRIKRRTFEILSPAEKGDIPSLICDIAILILIFINVIIVIADTFTLSANIKNVLSKIEFFSIIFFTAEYILRFWVADLEYPKISFFKAKIKYIFSFLAIVDLLAILPFYLLLIVSVDLRILRMLRIIRLLRIFKINRYSDAFLSIGSVFRQKSRELISSVSVVLILMIIAAVLMYNVENQAQPETFPNAFAALWWAVATLTTVGYGDIYPVTVAGKILSTIVALLGIGLVAVPSGIISSGFMEHVTKENEDEKKSTENDDDEKHFCPYCGKKIK